ncbi:ATP-grasp domain-containing protein [Leptospira santarosai]|uniref:ATP-grasp domain-containing protein n=1 Tax=Leptospira santarosai TaxID=28183 RepID=UPI0002BD9C9F|nr:ATP-grasp domain-containing protein [Leptospira santarosai]EMO84750.1 ATP-grasp domain protein [Leptospira santarosai str. AIM]
MKKILVIGSGWEQYELIRTIKESGNQIIATHPFINAEGFQLADHYYVKDSRDIAAHIKIATAHKVDAIVSDNCDYSLYTASIVASKIKVPFNTIESALYSNDKFRQREQCGKFNIQQPKFSKVRSIKDLVESARNIGLPVIIKPVDSRGTFGVTIVKDEAELEVAFYDAIDNSPSRTLICEKFIDGILVTVDGFCFKDRHRSLAVASRRFEKGPKPVTKEIVYPAEFSNKLNEKLLRNHELVVSGLGYHFGHSHGEYIVTNAEEIFLVECANRGGGVYTSSVIVPLLTDINLNQLLLDQCLGIDDFIPPEKMNGYMNRSAILTFLDFEVGQVIEDINIQEMRNMDYAVRFRSIYEKNDMVESIENCASRHSMLVIQGENLEDSFNNLNKFKECLKVKYYKRYD